MEITLTKFDAFHSFYRDQMPPDATVTICQGYLKDHWGIATRQCKLTVKRSPFKGAKCYTAAKDSRFYVWGKQLHGLTVSTALSLEKLGWTKFYVRVDPLP